jgi:tetratricopeptide (TPR) repeat protein
MGFRWYAGLRAEFSAWRRNHIYKVALAGWLLWMVALVACADPYDSALLKAQQFVAQGKLVSAAKLYEKAIPRIPPEAKRERAAAEVSYGDCLVALGKLREAFVEYQKAVGDDPQNLDAHQRMAQLLANSDQPQEAAQHAELVLKQRPDDAIALAVLGGIEANAGNNARAALLLQRALALDPQKPLVAISLAQVYAMENRIDDARKALVECAQATQEQKQAAFAWMALGRLEEQEGNKPGADAAYRAAVKTDDSPMTNFRLAQFLERSAKIDEAEQVLRHLDAMRPAGPSALAQTRLNAGRAQDALAALQVNSARAAAMKIEGDMRNGDAAAALTQYNRMLDPTAVAILRAEVDLERGDVSAAEASASQALQRSPDSAAAHYVRGLVFARQQRIAEAKEQWNSALESDASYVPAEIALAEQNLKEGDLTTAEKHASAVVRDEPANLEALCVFARVLLARGNAPAAEAIARRAIVVNESAAEPRIVMGQIAMHEKKYGAAFLEYERALLMEPDSPEALSGVLEVYRHGTVTPAVLQKMERVAMAPPVSPSLLEIAGRLYAAKGMRTEATRALQRCLQADPKRQTAAVALAEVRFAAGDKDPERSLMKLSDAAGQGIKSSVHLFQASAADQRGDVGHAITDYQLAVDAGESSGLAANNLAWDYAQQGTKLDQALKLASIAVDRNPKNPAAFDTLGVVQLKRRDYSQAVAALNKALSLMNGEEWRQQRPEVYKHLAEALENAGMSDKASEARAKAR